MRNAIIILPALSVLAPTAHAAIRPAAAAVDLARACVRQAMAHPARARAWARRSRLAAWLPELLVGAERDSGTRETVDPQDHTRYGTYALDEVRLYGRLTWRLDRLVLDPE